MDTQPCPKCGRDIPVEADDCPFCGIVLAKFNRETGGGASSEAGSAERTTAPPPPPPSATEAAEVLYDPDAPPTVEPHGESEDFTATTYGPVTGTMIDHLAATGPWVIFLAVLTLLSAVLMALAAVFSMALAEQSGVPALFLFLTYAVTGILYLVFALQLFNFGQAARQVGFDVDTRTIEEALRYQRVFWRFLGMVSLIGLVLVVLGFVAAIFLPMMLRG